MKTTKAKSAAGSAKVPAAPKTTRIRKTSASGSGPSEEQIRIKAQEIYNERINSGVWGTADDDWHKAEQILRDL